VAAIPKAATYCLGVPGNFRERIGEIPGDVQELFKNFPGNFRTCIKTNEQSTLVQQSTYTRN
jgi:hypothetical protein